MPAPVAPVHDPFSPFDPDDVDAINLPRLSRAEVDALTDAQIDEMFKEKPLSLCTISDHVTDEQTRLLRRFLVLHRDMFALNDKNPGQISAAAVTIDTKDRAPAAFPLRSTMPHMRPVVEAHVNDMLKYGIIRHSESPWAAALLLVPKKGINGAPPTTRCVTDFRLLNEKTETFSYPLLRIDDALASLNGNRYFTALDSCAAFFQCPLAEKDKCKTAFRCHMGQFEYNVMPFGIKNGPSFYQRYVDTVLNSLKFQCALAYADDVLVYSSTFEQHLIDLERVFTQFKSANFHFKAKKSSFAMPSVGYLGHVISADGIAPDPMKVKAIADAEPQSRDDVRSWCGLASYYRKFIRNFAHSVRPLTNFLNTKKKWDGLSPEMADAIATIKRTITSHPVLDHPDFSAPFEIHCDASPHAVGATLCQRINGTERVVQYISRALKKHELNYHQYEREALAVVWSLGVFRPYVLSRRFKCVTDNKAVTRIFQKNQSSRLIRWALTLADYDVEFIHRAATKHGDADALTRMSVPPVDYGCDIEALPCYECCSSCAAEEPICCPGCDSLDGCVCPPPPPHPTSCSTCCPVSLDEATTCLPSAAELIAAQRNDDFLNKHITKLDSSADNGCTSPDLPASRTRGDVFHLQQGVLMRRTTLAMPFRSGEGKETVDQICVPQVYRRAVLYSVHGIPMSGHDGVQRTLARLRQRFWWNKCEIDVAAWVKSCVFCNRRKGGQPKRQGLTEPILSQRPFDVVGFDIVGPLPEDKDGNRYLLTAVDHFTRYPLAIPITNREHATVVHALHRHLVCVFGPPRRLLSDCERSFVSEVTKGLFALMNIEKVNTSPYHPQTNGACERFHRYLNATITMFVNERKTDWSDYIDSILYAYRTSFCSSTGYSPFELFFGRKALMPPDIVYSLSTTQLENERKRGISVSDSMRTAYKYARRRQLRAAELNKNFRDKGRHDIHFKAGDLVWKYDRSYDTKGPQKFQFRFSGPYAIHGPYKKRQNLYVLVNVVSRETHVCNVDLLLPARADCSDLGQPLGWPKSKKTNARRAQPTAPPPSRPRRGKPTPPPADATVHEPTPPTIAAGDMVALEVAPDALEKMPFAVGKVLSIHGDRLTVWWYGNAHGNVLGAWRTGYYESTTSNRRYYSDRRLSPSHQRYTSTTSETELAVSAVIGAPFHLNRRNAIPNAVLRAASARPGVDWSLSQEDASLVQAVQLQRTPASDTLTNAP
jgi:transposase InsO family protein